MLVTTEQLVSDLYHLWREGKVGYSTSQRIQWLMILDKLDTLPDWHGRTVRTLQVPVFGSGVVLRLERTSRELVATFERLESPLGLGCHEEWRGNCELCDAVTNDADITTCEACESLAVAVS